jgi:hypothetical protein
MPQTHATHTGLHTSDGVDPDMESTGLLSFQTLADLQADPGVGEFAEARVSATPYRGGAITPDEAPAHSAAGPAATFNPKAFRQASPASPPPAGCTQVCRARGRSRAARPAPVRSRGSRRSRSSARARAGPDDSGDPDPPGDSESDHLDAAPAREQQGRAA